MTVRDDISAKRALEGRRAVTQPREAGSGAAAIARSERLARSCARLEACKRVGGGAGARLALREMISAHIAGDD